MNVPVKTQTTVRCRACYKQTAIEAASCTYCGGEIKPAEPKTVVAKIKRALGIELSDIVTLNLKDRENFFSNQEIDSILGLENLVVLDLEDVPNFDTMFYKSKRICKPINRNG